MKRPSFKTVGRYTAFGVFGLSIATVAAAAAGVRVNVTRSIPVGFYRTSAEPIHKGAYVMFCPPQREVFRVALKRRYIDPGSCPGGSYPMMKRILAAKDDRVQIGPQGVVINGVPVPNSKPRPVDGAGRTLPRFTGTGTVKAGDVIVMGENKVSFDSRYFGPIPRQQISTVIQPIVIW
ncbi:MAG: conjugative transfer signal peptidase TraF [Paracoccus denitrificans]|uniref:Conjugative transfer signal peptidase TraF n=1 Tax=Paracoccus denitrificans TaxID=266 RepID=A0A533I1M0_PARDE|nr:MAG: conjugative transfer signal peptidase TraF [Paracoccus denitrificans]